MEKTIGDAPEGKLENVFAPEIPADEAPEEIKFPWDTVGVEGPDFNGWVPDAQEDAGAVREDKCKKTQAINATCNKTTGSIKKINGLPL